MQLGLQERRLASRTGGQSVLIGQVLYTGYVVKLVQDVRDGRRDHTMDELFSAAAPGDAGRVILGTIGNVLVVPVEALVAGILFFDLGGGRGRASTTQPSAEEPGV